MTKSTPAQLPNERPMRRSTSLGSYWLVVGLLAAVGLMACAESKTTKCDNGIRCPAGMICSVSGGCVQPEACEGNGIDCNDDNTCTTDTCSAGTCHYDPVPPGAMCDSGSGTCNGMGNCITCDNVGEACITSRGCERGQIQCVNGTAACVPTGPADAGTECRRAAGDCDSAEVCDGVSLDCPSDVFLPAGMECRGAATACDIVEKCSGSSALCPADDPGCAANEYCLNAQCFDRPTYDLQGGEGDQCFDKGVAHPAPNPLPPPSQPPTSGFAGRAITRGRPGAEMFGYRIHLSCGGAVRGPFSGRDCYETGPGTDFVIPPGGTCTEVFFHDVPLADCPDPVGGRFEQFVVVDGIESNHDFLNFYNSTTSCSVDPLPTTCAAAESFCPCTGECATNPCSVTPNVCPSALLPQDTWDYDESDAGFSLGADTSFSTVEDAE